jgi:hypothetical protein
MTSGIATLLEIPTSLIKQWLRYILRLNVSGITFHANESNKEIVKLKKWDVI